MTDGKDAVWRVSLSGFVGGITPSLANLAGQLTSSFSETLFPSFGYLVGVIIYGAIGTVVAMILSNHTMQDAFKVGIAAPAIVFSLLNGVASAQSEENKPVGAPVTISSQWAPSLQIPNSAHVRPLSVSVVGESGQPYQLPMTGAFRIGEAFTLENVDELVTIQFRTPDGIVSYNAAPGDEIELQASSIETSFRDQLIWALTGVPRGEAGAFAFQAKTGAGTTPVVRSTSAARTPSPSVSYDDPDG